MKDIIKKHNNPFLPLETRLAKIIKESDDPDLIALLWEIANAIEYFQDENLKLQWRVLRQEKELEKSNKVFNLN